MLREEKGYTYGTRSAFTAPRRGGVFSLSGAVRTEVTSAAVADAVRILLAARDGLNEQEVAEAKDNLIRTAPLRYEQADSIAQQVGSNIAAGVPLDFADHYLAQIDATTHVSATEAYRTYVGASGLLIVAVGEAADITDGLRNLGLGERLTGFPQEPRDATNERGRQTQPALAMYLESCSRSNSSSPMRVLTTSPMLTMPCRLPSTTTGTCRIRCSVISRIRSSM